MADIAKLQENLRKRGFAVSYFETSQEANAYLVPKLAGKTIGMGGTMTVQEMGLDTALTEAGCHLICHRLQGDPKEAAVAPVYLSSLNGVAETGELVNIDGTGNRVASTIYGHEELYLIIGTNKVEPTLEQAIWRARNIASPRNAQRLGRKTPCAVHADRCYDCNSPERICRALAVLWEPPKSFQRVEVVIVNETLGL